MNKECVVVIPVYRPLDEVERGVVRQALLMTEGFTVRFVAGHSFVPDDTFAGFGDLDVERFDDTFFSGIPGYNRLMLDPGFYERFRDFKYVLIHQTDAYLFKPELHDWCARGWDYIGGPWFRERKLQRYAAWQFAVRRLRLNRFKPALRQALHNNVGNGGLSLRRVEAFLGVLEAASSGILSVHRKDNSPIFNEDIFWGMQAPLICPGFRIPKWREAMCFALDRSPSRLYEIMGEELPFGCHAFRKIKPEFWRKHIPLDF